MSDIDEKVLVHAPLASAARFLERFLTAHAGPKGEGARVELRAGDLAKHAVVTLVPEHRTGDMTPRYNVHWEAEEAGPYPVFDGVLTVAGDEDYNAFWLVLDGGYKPPGGLAGGLFDALVGHRIAETVTHGLFDTIRSEIEAAFAEEERAKRA
jgi:hypothetical protein